MATLSLLILLPGLYGQPAAVSEKCVFAGVVQDSLTGQRLPHARVGLFPEKEGGAAFATTTDSGGGFRFEAIEPGNYDLWASESEHAPSGSITLKSGQSTSIIECAGGQAITGAVAALGPQALISGHVMDTDGEPMPGVQVTLIVERWMNGVRTPSAMMGGSTDDRGEYRVTVLPGRYFVVAGVGMANRYVPEVFAEGPGKPEMRIATIFYPNATDIRSATPVDVKAGQQYGGIDFHLPSVVTYHVRGAVRPFASWTGPRALVLRRDGDPFGASPALDKDGGFDQAGVLPGNYSLGAMPMSQTSATTPVEVTDHDVSGIVFAVGSPVDIKGRVRFTEDGEHDFSKLRMRIDRLDTDHPLSRIDVRPAADGTFELKQMAAAVFSIRLDPPGDVYLQSATFNQRDVENGRLDLTGGAGGELEILLGTGAGTVSGTLRRPEGAGNGGRVTMAVLASANGVTGNTGARKAAIDANGRFQFPFVPPGRYYVWAVSQFDPDQWQNMDFVTRMEDRGTAVEVSQKGTAQVEIPAVVE